MPTNNNQIDKDNSAKTQKLALIRTHQEVRSGPIPSPSEMKQYSEVDSSLPNRIMAMAEKEQQQTYELRKSIIDKRDFISCRDYDYDVKALRYCTFLCFLFMLLAALLFYLDKTGAAVFFGVTAFITLPKVYLAPRANKTGKNKEDKTEQQ